MGGEYLFLTEKQRHKIAIVIHVSDHFTTTENRRWLSFSNSVAQNAASLSVILVRSPEAVKLKFGISPIMDLVAVNSSIGLGVICVFSLCVSVCVQKVRL